MAEVAAHILGFGIPTAPTTLDPLPLEELEDRPPDAATYADLWGDWVAGEPVAVGLENEATGAENVGKRLKARYDARW